MIKPQTILIMILIKIIILYFIQIRHTDDFPLNGYPASLDKRRLVVGTRQVHLYWYLLSCHVL